MKIKDLSTLYVESLRDLYSAETQLVEALPKVAKAISDEDLRAAFRDHLKETKGQVKRLEQIFEELGEDPAGHECAAMKGLIEEADELIADVSDPAVRDAALIGGAQKVEHYEIAGYGTVRALAKQLGHDEHIKLLQASLDEEGACDKTLTQFALGEINDQAAEARSDKSRTSTRAITGAVPPRFQPARSLGPMAES